MTSALPAPFPCPVCAADDVLVRADVYIWLGGLRVAKGYHFDLADNSRWHCEVCEHGGDVTKDGPVDGTAVLETRDTRDK